MTAAATDWERYLASLAAFGMRPGLERVTALLGALDRPQRRFRAIHVVGTNGKSSTARYAAAVLRAEGLRSGTYLSPHITGFAERVLVDGRPASDEAFGAAVTTVRELVPTLPAELGETTQFEVLTVAAFLAMAESGVEVAAIEAGRGGRLDATNVLHAPVVVLTNIALEHTEVLGDTRELIFAEKAAVVHGGDAVFGPLDGLEGEAARACAAAGARPHFWERDLVADGTPQAFAVQTAGARYEGLSVPSEALYQVTNAALAVQAAELLLGSLHGPAVRTALARTAVPGRLQVVGREPLMLADGAHNPAGVRTLLASLEAIEWPRPRVAVLAVMRDKAYPEMLALLLPHLDAVVCTQAGESRSLGADELAAAARATLSRSQGRPAGGRQVEAVARPHEAIARARSLAGAQGSVLVSGSLYLLEDLADLVRAGDAGAAGSGA
jgi:dihydrofolate synthase/folylpolyglutamate synthase